MRVFISYRSADTRDKAEQIRRKLEESNKGLEPFEYKRSTPAGAEWEEAIRQNLSRSDVMVVLIGKKWLELLLLKDPEGDMVRYEISAALSLGIRLIPVLVDGAEMPKAEQLPKDLEALVKRMAIGDDVDLAEQICRNSNWVIVSQRSPFTSALRNALEKEREELGIIRFPKFALPAEQHHIEYPRLLRQFIREAPPGSWLFTNYPEDDLNKQPPEVEEDLITKLLSRNRRMICFESGHNLWKRAEDLARNGNIPVNPVGVIDTDAPHAIEALIKHMTDNVWRREDIHQIEIVSVMGPRAANTQERGRKYLEFFGCVQHGLQAHGFDNVCRDLGTKVLCTTVTQPMPTWRPEHCEPEILKFLKFRNPKNQSAHTTFLCGNDDLAFIVYNAVKTSFTDDVQQGRVSFVGFDGMPSMDKIKETLKGHAATAKVNFDEMVKVAGEWLQAGEVKRQSVLVSSAC